MLSYRGQLAELELQIEAAQKIEDDLKIHYNDILSKIHNYDAYTGSG